MPHTSAFEGCHAVAVAPGGSPDPDPRLAEGSREQKEARGKMCYSKERVFRSYFLFTLFLCLLLLHALAASRLSPRDYASLPYRRLGLFFREGRKSLSQSPLLTVTRACHVPLAAVSCHVSGLKKVPFPTLPTLSPIHSLPSLHFLPCPD